MNRAAIVLVVLLLSVAMQASIAPKLAIYGALPDFVLLAIAWLSMGVGSDQAAIIGFFGGVLQGGVANAKMSAYVVSRVLAAIAASVVGKSTLAATPLTVVACGFATSASGSILFLLFGAQRNFLSSIWAALGTTIYNTVLFGIITSVFSGRLGRVFAAGSAKMRRPR
jgi:hypothetical protein